VGGLLGLRPILHIVDGMVEQAESVRGSKKMLKLITEGVVEAVKDDVQNVNISVGHIMGLDDAMTIRSSIETALDINITNPVDEVGVTIGTHAGPGALVVAYCKKFESFIALGVWQI